MFENVSGRFGILHCDLFNVTSLFYSMLIVSCSVLDLQVCVTAHLEIYTVMFVDWSFVVLHIKYEGGVVKRNQSC